MLGVPEMNASKKLQTGRWFGLLLILVGNGLSGCETSKAGWKAGCESGMGGLMGAVVCLGVASAGGGGNDEAAGSRAAAEREAKLKERLAEVERANLEAEASKGNTEAARALAGLTSERRGAPDTRAAATDTGNPTPFSQYAIDPQEPSQRAASASVPGSPVAEARADPVPLTSASSTAIGSIGSRGDPGRVRPLSVAIFPFAKGGMIVTNDADHLLPEFADRYLNESRQFRLLDFGSPEVGSTIGSRSDYWSASNQPLRGRVLADGARVGADAVLLYSYSGRYSMEDRFEFTAYLFDVQHQRSYRSTGNQDNYEDRIESLFDDLVAGQTTREQIAVEAPPLSRTTKVDARASGMLGAYETVPDLGSLGLVEAFVFTSPSTVRIEVEGKIDLHPSYPRAMGIGPDGMSWRRGGTGNYTPLEEATVDSRGTNALPMTISSSGALFGVFVPASKVAAPGFRAFNDDFPGGGISPADLFLIGSELDFTASEPGTLYVGINDARPRNNSGHFLVTVSPVRPAAD